MYNILRRMYLSKPQKIDKAGLDKAVLKGWISLEQENEILSLAQKGGDPLSLDRAESRFKTYGTCRRKVRYKI